MIFEVVTPFSKLLDCWTSITCGLSTCSSGPKLKPLKKGKSSLPSPPRIIEQLSVLSDFHHSQDHKRVPTKVIIEVTLRRLAGLGAASIGRFRPINRDKQENGTSRKVGLAGSSPGSIFRRRFLSPLQLFTLKRSGFNIWG